MSDDFLSRWSRRKREGEPKESAEAVAPAVETEAPPEESDDELLTRLGLKHPDQLAQGDDFAAFLKAEVPKHLKALALRRLWRSNPTLACLDGLNDYDTDFTGTGVGPGGLRTSYQVGRGILSRIVDVADDEDAGTPDAVSAAREPGQAAPSQSAETRDVPAADTLPASPEDQREAAAAESVQPHEPTDPPRATRRRMVFRSKDDSAEVE